MRIPGPLLHRLRPTLDGPGTPGYAEGHMNSAPGHGDVPAACPSLTLPAPGGAVRKMRRRGWRLSSVGRTNLPGVCAAIPATRRGPRSRIVVAVYLAIVCTVLARPAIASAPSVSSPVLRVFLKDGTPLVCYGEYTRSGDRVVFAVPLGSAASPDALQVITLPADTIDWERTTSYADAARYQRYAATRGDADYTALTAEVARALSEIALSPDPARTLAVARETRAMLVGWPRTHYGYRATEVRDLALVFDEAISSIQANLGESTFHIDLVATLEPPRGDLMPEPTLAQSIESARATARASDSPAERLSLQRAILSVLDLHQKDAASPWVSSARSRIRSDMREDEREQRAYARFSARALGAATSRAASGDVAGVEQVLADARISQARLGLRRPDDMAVLFAALDARLVAARTRRLELDRWQFRIQTWGKYKAGAELVLTQLNHVLQDVDAVRKMAGPDARSLSRSLSRIELASRSLADLEPPGELRDSHSTLASAIDLMLEALRRRREAALLLDMQAASNAAAAAAGSLLLLDRSRSNITAYFQRPGSR
jgi:hypothetical protein